MYGPSVTPLESPGRDGVHHVSLVALHSSKAMHEFLVLHYMATDSAEEWDTFLDLCLPECTVRAGSRRALAMHMYDKCHVAPSHKRLAHPSWIAGMKIKSMSVLLQRHLPSPPLVEHASCPAGGYIGWHCSSSGIIAWNPALTTVPSSWNPPHS